MDKYTKIILTIIAVSLLGINFQMMGGSLIQKAFAAENIQKVIICDPRNTNLCANVRENRNSGHQLIVEAR